MQPCVKAYVSHDYAKVWEKEEDKYATEVYLSKMNGILEIHAYYSWQERCTFCHQQLFD